MIPDTFEFKLFLTIRKLQLGEVIAYPTESVYGLGCDPNNHDAINKLLSIKKRSYRKGLILIGSTIEQFTPFITPLSSEQLKLINAKTDRVTSWLVKAKDNTSHLICGEKKNSDKKIVIRLSRHPVIRIICERLEYPIISTSANISGKPMCYSALETRLHFKNQLGFILNAPLGKSSKPSQIIELATRRILRK